VAKTIENARGKSCSHEGMREGCASARICKGGLRSDKKKRGQIARRGLYLLSKESFLKGELKRENSLPRLGDEKKRNIEKAFVSK